MNEINLDTISNEKINLNFANNNSSNLKFVKPNYGTSNNRSGGNSPVFIKKINDNTPSRDKIVPLDDLDLLADQRKMKPSDGASNAGGNNQTKSIDLTNIDNGNILSQNMTNTKVKTASPVNILGGNNINTGMNTNIINDNVNEIKLDDIMNIKTSREASFDLPNFKTGDIGGNINNNNMEVSLPYIPPEAPQKSVNEIKREKQDLLFKLDRLNERGLPVTKKFTMQHSLEEMQEEYNRLKSQREMNLSIKFQRKMLMCCVTGIEFLNNRYDPFDIKLDKWSEDVSKNVNDYDDIFEELHEKYKGKGNIAPELRLMAAIGGSAFMYNLNKSIFQTAPVGMEDVFRQNPNLMRQFNETVAGMANGGMQQPQYNAPPPRQSQPFDIGGMMGSIFGGNQGKNNVSNMDEYLNRAPSPPPQQSQMREPPPKMRHEMDGVAGLDNILNQINPASSAVKDADRFENFSTASEKDIMNTNNIKSININKAEKRRKKKTTKSSDDGGMTLNL